MSVHRRNIMAKRENNPYEKLDYLTIIKSDPSEFSVGIDIYPAQFAFEYEYEEDGEVYYEYDYIWPDIEYSKDDGQTWHPINFKPNFEEWEKVNYHFYLYGNETIKLRSDGASFYNTYSYYMSECYDYMTFRISTGSGKVNLAGTPNSLLWSEIDNLTNDLTYDSCFNELFYACSGIQNILNPKTFLPSMNLSKSCYSSMFVSCQNLKNAPELPATTLKPYCYNHMFSGCSNLTTTTKLRANLIPEHAYSYMFYNCTSLVNAPELPATTLEENAYAYMFYNCTSLVNAPIISATTLTNKNGVVNKGHMSYMFYNCTSLVNIPKTLLAQHVYYNSYGYMFYNCTSLTTTPELPATELADYCYNGMFRGCTSLTTAPELPATTLYDSCYYYMFSGCTSLTTAPVLPAKTLKSQCYEYMFASCRKLNYVKALFTTKPTSSYTNSWLTDVSSTGTFVKGKDATWNVTGVNGVPSGWTVVIEGNENSVGSGSTCCFEAGTQVLTSLDGTTKNIEDFKTNDTVISYSTETDTNYEANVKDLILNRNSINMAKIVCEDGTELVMTDYHPLYTKEGWKSLTNYKGYPTLTENDILKTVDDWSAIRSIERYTLEEPITTYTLNVIDKDEVIDNNINDSFYANGIVVHNACASTV